MYKGELVEIEKMYGDRVILNSLDFSIKDGERVSILGPSGCGKSTLFKIFSGLDEDFSGKVLLNGKDITNTPTNKRKITMVSQENLLFPHMTVFENIAFSLRAKKEDEKKIYETVNSLLREIELTAHSNKKPNSLSGGEKQRVALARALASEPEILLLDEAFSSLDTNLREDMRELTIRLQEKNFITTILVTHDRAEAMHFSDRIAVMSNGTIGQYDTPKEVYNSPNSLEIAKFLHSDNFIETEKLKDIIDDIEPGMLMILPENISLNKNGIGLSTKITGKINLGSYNRYTVEFENLLINDYGDREYEIGEKVSAEFKKYCVYKD